MNLTTLTAIAPIDGRYWPQTQALSAFFSEQALMRYRLFVEIEYLIALAATALPPLTPLSDERQTALRSLYRQFSERDALHIKQIEAACQHDVKAIEYYLQKRLHQWNYLDLATFIHFGLTSQDINNTAIPLAMRDALTQVYLPALAQVIDLLNRLSQQWENIPMLAHTHGQPASPTFLGKEMGVFVERLVRQKDELVRIPHAGKFGGATGNMNAHYAAYPHYNWHAFAQHFLHDVLKLHRSFPTTQIEHYDYLAAQCDALRRLHVILLDLCRDMWLYISMGYFRQLATTEQVGSSTMPHKINPIDFENAEGNLGLSIAILHHLASKLPVSRLQRDLSDSTVLRNLGLPIAYGLIALTAICKGLEKLDVAEDQIHADLERHWEVVTEAIQTILRREKYPHAYETLKNWVRSHQTITAEAINRFIDELEVSASVKDELKRITPFTFTGRIR